MGTADTETLREAHERQKRMQRQLHEQPSTVDTASDSNLSFAKVKSPPKPTLAARSTSASALSGSAATDSMSDANGGAKNSTGTVQPYLSGSSATSPFFGAADYHCQHPSAAAQLRSATQSPAFLSKFYDAEHRLPNAIPWLALPGAATPIHSGTESPNIFGRRRSDGSLTVSGTSTPHEKHVQETPQQENLHPHPPQAQHHHHHHHLLSHQELAALSRNNSPMPINEALPSYLRKKSADSTQSMERSISNPGSNNVHTTSASPFVLPIHQTSLTVVSAPHGNTSSSHTASPSHLLFPFTGSNQTNRPEMERASSTGVLPMNRQYQGQNRHHSHHRNQAQSGATHGPSTSLGNLPAITGGSASGNSGTSSFFRTSTPLGGVPSSLGGYGPHSTSFGSSPTKLNPFGHSGDSNIPSNKEVHA
ncbi:hypothetical protein BGX27_007084 [Mortierella sp. AM989]|nr:hypothetical protein BGX27_007084 [Mortierella sp. AM989]